MIALVILILFVTVVFADRINFSPGKIASSVVQKDLSVTPLQKWARENLGASGSDSGSLSAELKLKSIIERGKK